jgi:putative alpha-1,2-mannosidase
MMGGAPFQASFSSEQYNAYFCADFKGASIRDNGIFVNSRASADIKSLRISRSINGFPLPGGGFIRFPAGTSNVTARVGMSLISAKQACESAEKEIPDFQFELVKAAAQKLWREKLGSIRIDTKGVNSTFAKIFYSGIYRTMISPQDYTGENPLWKSTEPYFDSFYCIWDSFRTHFPMLVLIDPPAMTKMIRALIDIYVYDGWLPDCRMSLSRGYTQGGSNADVVLTDAYVKGITKDINWELGYKAVVKDAEEEPFDWSSRGRGGLESWKTLGYIPAEDFTFKGFGTITRSISRTLEYSYNDFAIAQLAKKLNKTADVQKYLERSRNWQNLYNPDTPSVIKTNDTTKDTGFKGFFQPRFANKTWGYQDPLQCSRLSPTTVGECSLQNTGGEMYESSIWEYGFFVPHDGASLVKTFGGPTSFVNRLNYLHDTNISSIENEPSFLTVFQYHYAGRPGLSANRSHSFIPSYFSGEKDGIPGNDDSGTMGAFVSFNMMGLYPNAGQDVYFIIPPYFKSVNITSPLSNKTATVRVENFDPTYKAIYIQNATLNGKTYMKNWLTHDFFVNGGQLVLTVGEKESAWGTRVEDLPPSVGEYAPMEPMPINTAIANAASLLNGSKQSSRPAPSSVKQMSRRSTDGIEPESWAARFPAWR